MKIYSRMHIPRVPKVLIHRRFLTNHPTKTEGGFSNENLGYDSNLPYFTDSLHDYWIRILLIRHAESLGNQDMNLLKSKADHAIPLSERGLQQAREIGLRLKEFLKEQKAIEEQNESKKSKKSSRMPKHLRLWTSPYRRARETADEIMAVAGEYITDRREHILLGEQQILEINHSFLFQAKVIGERK